MKKYFYSMAIIAVFAIGFAASDDSSNVNEPVTNQNSISDSVVQENKPTQSTDDSEYAKAGYNRGFFCAQSDNAPGVADQLEASKYANDDIKQKVNDIFNEVSAREYDAQYGVPTTAEEAKHKEEYMEQFRKGFEDGVKIRKTGDSR